MRLGSTARQMRELETIYEETRGNVVDLVAGLDDYAGAIPVPACPAWSIKDVIAHLAGNGADVLNGNIEGVATTRWTDAQVEARRDWKLGDILAEWDDVGPRFASLIDDFPGWLGRQVIGDLTVHEHDIRGALGKPGRRDSPGVANALDFLLTVVVGSGAVARGVGPVDVRTETGSWVVGTGDAATGNEEAWRDIAAGSSPPPAATRPPAATVTAPAFELFRAATGRRSASQIRAFDWTTEPGDYIPIFGSAPFSLRHTDLQE